MQFDFENEVDRELSDNILDADNSLKWSGDASIHQPTSNVSSALILILVSVIMDSAARDKDSLLESPVVLNTRMSFTQHNSVGYIIYH